MLEDGIMEEEVRAVWWQAVTRVCTKFTQRQHVGAEGRIVPGAVNNGSLHKVDVLEQGSMYSLATPIISLSEEIEQQSKCSENSRSKFLPGREGRSKYWNKEFWKKTCGVRLKLETMI